MKTDRVDLNSLQQLAFDIAARYVDKRNPKIIGLEGDLGSGKTTFVTYLAQALGVKKRVQSPTFVIARHYPFKIGTESHTLYHLDLYRLDQKAVENIGLEDYLQDPQGLTVIEWSDKIAHLLPISTLNIKFEYVDSQTRKLSINRY